MTAITTSLRVHAIDPDRLESVRSQGTDGHGNPFTSFAAEGGEPLRCCLRPAAPGDAIALISYAPFDHPSPWTEVGPVYVHAHACAGYEADELPPALRTGPRVLRTYRADDTLDYDHITLVEKGVDIEAALRELLAEPEVATVHVRSLLPQCFLYAVTR